MLLAAPLEARLPRTGLQPERFCRQLGTTESGAGPAWTISAASGSGAAGAAAPPKNSWRRRAASRARPVEIAANAETPIAGKVPRAIEDRQARQFDRQAAAAIDRPVQRDAAPGLRAWQTPSSRGHRDRARRPRAISLHSRPKPAAVRGPIRRANSSAPSEKRPSRSICHMKRSGSRRVRRRLVEPGPAP